MKNLVIVIALVSAMAVSACNTVKGAGRDLESASDTVKNGM